MSTAHDDLALEALRAYEMRAPSLTFLGHNDSITYLVAEVTSSTFCACISM